MRNCAPWNGALTVTGGSIGLSGCSNGYGRGTSYGIHLGPMTGEAPTLRCDTLLHFWTLSDLYQCLILFRQKAVGGWVSKSLEKVGYVSARICMRIGAGRKAQSTLSFSDVAPFITSSERMHILSDCPAPSLKTSWEGSHRPLRTRPAFSLEAAMNE